MSNLQLRVGYFDPPYPGEAYMYKAVDANAAEVDHAALIARAELDFPDGWALSTKSSALKDVLALCPSGVRVAAWVKPFCSFKPGVNPAYAWEPVIWKGGRSRGRELATVRDWVSANVTLRTGMPGAKPPAFWFWLFDLLGLSPADQFKDIFPGSGGGADCWEAFCARWRPAQLELEVQT